ncbi:hypothetical protein IEO21_08032 [Rhodonia placenta]|uniref:C2H2-type domain-containing protein n=1 Tax=Rhodonia placenta TaxID=104341 RepID=A0A8H7NWX9_9APHY|nr:hypothetical protein IEO21_08032 [Postia placenta]
MPVYCDPCGRWFVNSSALEQHEQDSPKHRPFECPVCDDRFQDEEDVDEHREEEHNCCIECERYFGSYGALEQHRQNSPKHNLLECPICDDQFSDEDDLDEHRKEEHHCCIQCDRYFVNEGALEQHDSAKHYFECPTCDDVYNSKDDLDEHRADEHNCCVECARNFQSQQNLQTHLKSSAHRDRTLPCPGRKCTKRFISGAGLLLHLESGMCPSKLTRERINQLAVHYDRTNVITNASRLVAGPDGYAMPQPPVISIATSLSFNGQNYECFLCHREYKTLDRLNQHLSSPAHDDEIYRCPKAWDGCGAEFRTLSALCQHVESEQCGIRKFNDPMQNVMEKMSAALKGLLL